MRFFDAPAADEFALVARSSRPPHHPMRRAVTSGRHDTSQVTAVAATATAIIAGDAAGSVWFLDWPPSTI